MTPSASRRCRRFARTLVAIPSPPARKSLYVVRPLNIRSRTMRSDQRSPRTSSVAFSGQSERRPATTLFFMAGSLIPLTCGWQANSYIACTTQAIAGDDEETRLGGTRLRCCHLRDTGCVAFRHQRCALRRSHLSPAATRLRPRHPLYADPGEYHGVSVRARAGGRTLDRPCGLLRLACRRHSCELRGARRGWEVQRASGRVVDRRRASGGRCAVHALRGAAGLGASRACAAARVSACRSSLPREQTLKPHTPPCRHPRRS